MEDPRVALFYLSGFNVVAIREALVGKGVSKIIKLVDYPEEIDTSVNFVIVVIDDDFKDFDIKYFHDGRPDWREKMAYRCLICRIRLIHRYFPSAKIILVDCTGMTSDDLYNTRIEEGNSSFNFHFAQLERERKVFVRLRRKYRRVKYFVHEDFSLYPHEQHILAERIAELITA